VIFIGWTLVALPLFLGAYAFVLYPALLWLWSRVRAPYQLPPEPTDWPVVTVLIVAYNEVARIGRTISHALAVDYPPDRLHILVVSDASTDGTDELITGLKNPRVHLLRMAERQGKPAGENAAGQMLQGDIVVSIDASILIPRDSLKPLVRALEDESVGLASGTDLSVGAEEEERNAAESSYVDLEMKLRLLETRVGTIVGASGCFYANRRELQEVQLPTNLARDFAAASVAQAHGYRSVSVAEAVCLVPRTPSLGSELRRKTRTMTRGLATLFYLREMLNPFKHGRFAFFMWSHKLVRWLLFPSLIGWLVGPLFLARQFPPIVFLLFGMLVGLLLSWIVVHAPNGKTLPRWVAAPGYVFVSIVAGWLAWWKALKGEKHSLWEPTRRPAVDGPSPT